MEIAKTGNQTTCLKYNESYEYYSMKQAVASVFLLTIMWSQKQYLSTARNPLAANAMATQP